MKHRKRKLFITINKDFLNKRQKAQIIKEQNKLNYIKVKMLCSSKDTLTE